MFETLADFSKFFFSVGGLLFIGILFEEKFIALEDRLEAMYQERKKKRGKAAK